ncbi:hypothetical protein EG328_010806 [Venturia inaequalis]|uniref:Uncharacterized protein n=1 Tax=Venturia inaequalis TaxID=5025 RepID=A0A8H3ZB30_VENIN|nr:hypothetical protein EG328_010806 [Venturia inaequalis]KAE9985871.1 hypothetical protein EG327_004513 [Venturia inaequalis]RDI80296.1 hypothetical protein Vi05172_g9775 [Venturia inaequalis]
MNRDYTANCAICNGPGDPECPCEGDRLKIAIDQAEKKWIESWVAKTREWVTNNAINTITTIYNKKKEVRQARHLEYLQNLPYWPLYVESRGRPNLHPHIVADLQRRMADAQLDLKRGIDADWKECVVRYPQVLAHFYAQLSVKIPREADMPFTNPVNNGQPRAPPPPPQMIGFDQQHQRLQAQQQQAHQQQMAAQINRASTVQPVKKARRQSKVGSEFSSTGFDLDELARNLEGLGRSSTAMGRAKSGTPGPPPSATPGPRERLHRTGTGKKRESKEYAMPSGRGAAPSLVGGHAGIPPHVPVPPSWATGSNFDMGVRY